MKPTMLHDAGEPGAGAEALRERLVRLALGGTAARQAAARLYESHAPRLRAFLRMLRLAPEHIEEVVQEVFVRLLAAPGPPKKAKSPRAYLWSVLRAAFTDHLRHVRRQRRRFAEPTPGAEAESAASDWPEPAGTSGTAPEPRALREILAQALERFLREQPERATAIALVAIEGLDASELACALGKTRRGAREYQAQACRALRALAPVLATDPRAGSRSGDACLTALAGHLDGPAPPGSGEELAALCGELLRARFALALHRVRAAPDPELTRARVLAAASAGRPLPRDGQRVLIATGAASAGLAAGIVGTLLLQPAPLHSAHAEPSQPLIAPSGPLPRAPASPARPPGPALARYFVLHRPDVPETGAQLAALLVQAGASFRVTRQSAGELRFDVEPMSPVPETLAQDATGLEIEIPPDTPIRVDLVAEASN